MGKKSNKILIYSAFRTLLVYTDNARCFTYNYIYFRNSRMIIIFLTPCNTHKINSLRRRLDFRFNNISDSCAFLRIPKLQIQTFAKTYVNN